MPGDSEQSGFGGALESDNSGDIDAAVKILEQASEGGGESDEGLVVPKGEETSESSEEGDENAPDPEEEPEGDDEEENEEESKEENKDELEDDLNLRARPTYNSITRKFPEFFKTFPEIKEMMGREAEYSKRFPTVEAADEALDKSTEFDQITDHLADGNIKGLLDTVASVSDSSLNNVVDKFLPSLLARDQQLYLRAVTPSLAVFVKQFFDHGVSKGDKNIQNAALIASEWIFDTEDYATGKKAYPNPAEQEKDPERIKLNKEREQFLSKKHNDLHASVVSVAETKLNAKIDEGLKNLSGLNEFTKNTIKEKIFAEVGERLQNDPTHMKLMTSLWGRARREGYDDPVWKTRLVTAYLARAIALVPSVRAKVVGQALEHRKSAVKQGSDKGRQQQTIKVTSQRQGGSQQQVARVTNRLPADPRMIDRKKTSDLDILNGRITLKGK